MILLVSLALCIKIWLNTISFILLPINMHNNALVLGLKEGRPPVGFFLLYACLGHWPALR